MGPVLKARLALQRLAFKKTPLSSLTLADGIYNGPQFVRNYVDHRSEGVPFLTGSTMLLGEFSNLPRISKKDATSKKLEHLRLNRGLTLISCSGTIGKMAYSRADMEGIWASQDILKVAPDPDKIDAGYLYAYLRGTFGIPLIVAGTYGGVIQHLEPEHIANVPVPRIGNVEERNVHKLMEKSADLLCAYSEEIQAATDDFFASVGLKDVLAEDWHGERGDDLGFSVEAVAPQSFRSLGYAPRFLRLCDSMRTVQWRSLGDICVKGTLTRGGRYTRVDADPEYGVQFVGQKELFNLQPEGRCVAINSVGPDVYVQEGTILAAAQGTLGENELYCRSELVTGPWLQMAYSEHLLRIVADEAIMLRGCLFSFMRSETAFRMLRAISSGSKLQDNNYFLLPRLPIPIPDDKAQKRINRLVIDAYRKRHEAVELEREAVKRVEQILSKS